jgi:hypothetical protein
LSKESRERLTASDSVGELSGDGDVRSRILSRDYYVRKERKSKSVRFVVESCFKRIHHLHL